MMFRVVKQINHIGSMKTFTKPNYNLRMDKCLTILKKLRDKNIKLSKVNGGCVYEGK